MPYNLTTQITCPCLVYNDGYFNSFTAESIKKKKHLEAYSEPYQISKIERFAKMVDGWKPLTIFAKRSFLVVWQSSEHASDIGMK